MGRQRFCLNPLVGMVPRPCFILPRAEVAVYKVGLGKGQVIPLTEPYLLPTYN